MDILATVAERKIREAMARGELDDLPGKGKPLVMEEDLTGVPAELRMAYKILKNAGFAPPEVELRREILSLQQLVDSLEDGEERRRKRKEINDKLLKLSVLCKRPLHLEACPEYREKVIGKLGA
jgi:hypothetical protein